MLAAGAGCVMSRARQGVHEKLAENMTDGETYADTGRSTRYERAKWVQGE